MSVIITDVDSRLLASLLALLMFAAWWTGKRLAKEKSTEEGSKFTDATMAILGLLLGFTFAMSLSKHDQRRQMVVADSNAVGDFYTCASLVKPEDRADLQDEIRKYAEYRLAIIHEGLDETKLDEIQRMHNQMQQRVDHALKSNPAVAVPLVNTLNNLTSNHAARLAAARDRLPPSILLVLLLAAILVMALQGYQQGRASAWRVGGTFGFIVLVSAVIWLILDLNQPQQGTITVSQESMQRVLKGMSK